VGKEVMRTTEMVIIKVPENSSKSRAQQEAIRVLTIPSAF